MKPRTDKVTLADINALRQMLQVAPGWALADALQALAKVVPGQTRAQLAATVAAWLQSRPKA